VKKLIVAAIAVSLLVPASAAAYAPSKLDMSDALHVAQNYWEHRGYDSTCRMVTYSAHPFWGSHYGSLGYTSGCRINFNSLTSWNHPPHAGKQQSWWRVCPTGIHEWGHLPGINRLHNHNPSSIMAIAESVNTSAWWWPYFPKCEQPIPYYPDQPAA
jgi:hypothetical protein